MDLTFFWIYFEQKTSLLWPHWDCWGWCFPGVGFDPSGNEMIPGFIFAILLSFLLSPKGRKGLGKAAAGGKFGIICQSWTLGSQMVQTRS